MNEENEHHHQENPPIKNSVESMHHHHPMEEPAPTPGEVNPNHLMPNNISTEKHGHVDHSEPAGHAAHEGHAETDDHPGTGRLTQTTPVMSRCSGENSGGR